MFKHLIFAGCIFLASCAFFGGTNDGPPQAYTPNYVYGSTPMGVYVGNPDEVGSDMVDDDIYLPNGEPMTEYQAQSGQPEQEFQYIQGQEQLMQGNAQNQIQQYQQEQKIGESLERQYQKQINQQKQNNKPIESIQLPQL